MWIVACSSACAAAAAVIASVSGSTSTPMPPQAALEVCQLVERRDLVLGEALLVAGEPVEAGHVAGQQRVALVGGGLVGHPHRLLAVVGEVRVLAREVTRPHEV